MGLETIKRANRIIKNEGIGSFLFSFKYYLYNLAEIPPTRFRHLRYNIRYGDSSPEPYRLLFVDPHAIGYVLIPSFRSEIITRGTHIKRGNWDIQVADEVLSTTEEVQSKYGSRRLVRFSNYGLHRAIDEHITNQKPWSETSYYDAKVAQGVSEEELERERKETVELYHTIKQEGYRLQEELSEVKKEKGPPEYDEIRINIGRNGQLILDDCRHRLSIARILDLETIPVRVFARHAEWQRVRHRVADIQEDPKDCLINHPDLQDVINFEAWGSE